jgi:hypothetical protein
MENVILQFHTKAQLLDFCAKIDGIRCTIDLERLTLSSAFTEPVIELAIRRYGVSIFADNLIY